MLARSPFRAVPGALAACLVLAACQAPPTVATAPVLPDPAPVDGIGYVVLGGPIDRVSGALLIQDIEKLRARGAHRIALGIDSPGGEFDAAESIVAEMDRLRAGEGIEFDAYDLGLVASAAALVFLDAGNRYAAPRSSFVFHAPVAVASGAFSADALREDADQVDRAVRTFRNVLLARTRLTRPQADVYVSRTVLLSTDDAQHDGVIDAVRPYVPPKGAGIWIVGAKPGAPNPARRPVA